MNAPSTLVTMSSREIAEITGKQHKNVIRDIRTMIDQLYSGCSDLSNQEKQGLIIEHCPQTKRVSCYHLDRYHSEILVTGYDIKRRAAIIKRWMEMEAKTPQFNVPQTYPEALRLAADLCEQNAQLLVENATMRPKAAYVDRTCAAEGEHSIAAAAKILRTGPTRLRNWLKAHKIIMSNSLPYQPFIDRGFFRVIETLIRVPYGDKLHRQTFVTAKGMHFLQAKLDSQPVVSSSKSATTQTK